MFAKPKRKDIVCEILGNRHSDYDLPIENYLASFDPGANHSRCDMLIHQWHDEATGLAKHRRKKATGTNDPLESARTS